ncbi:unnamed protein product [Dovyalis caffra]|uniref:Uncharacterized protein n=1 Tax=Dovyalis caffra TaxID=77055 RepID=A0AAV1QZZ0_9ROSI|nr:unnamed protein product [Dovyalis caffra]
MALTQHVSSWSSSNEDSRLKLKWSRLSTPATNNHRRVSCSVAAKANGEEKKSGSEIECFRPALWSCCLDYLRIRALNLLVAAESWDIKSGKLIVSFYSSLTYCRFNALLIHAWKVFVCQRKEIVFTLPVGNASTRIPLSTKDRFKIS